MRIELSYMPTCILDPVIEVIRSKWSCPRRSRWSISAIREALASVMNNYERLLTWARSHGAIIPSSLVFLSTPYGYCQSTTPIATGTALFHIPHTLLITPSVADTALPQLHSLSVHARVCTFLALERRKHGFWKEYLDSLPQTFETPAYFTEEELNILRGTNLFFAWRDRIDLWKEEYHNVEKIISDINWYL
jgi:hypothetical protein